MRGLPDRGKIGFWFIVVTLLGIWPALTNRQPFFFPDTTVYIRDADFAISKGLGDRFATDWAKDQQRSINPQSSVIPDEPSTAREQSSGRVVLVGRSIIYGALLDLGQFLGGMWFSIIVQSLIACYLIFVFVVSALGLDVRWFLISCAVLLIASPLPFFTSFLMPDVFAGFLILAFAILATSWARLSRFDRISTSAVMLFAVLSHTTHLILLIGLSAVTAAYYGIQRRRTAWTNVHWLSAVVVGCVVITVLWEAAFSFAVTRAIGSQPLRPPFITAKLVSMLGEPAVSKVCRSGAFVGLRLPGPVPHRRRFISMV